MALFPELAQIVYLWGGQKAARELKMARELHRTVRRLIDCPHAPGTDEWTKRADEVVKASEKIQTSGRGRAVIR